MKNSVLIIMTLALLQLTAPAQNASKELEATVENLDKAKTVKDYQGLADHFLKIAELEKTNWLSWYYAAFCNAKIGWLYQEDGDKIEPYANLADEQITKSQALLDTGKQKNELSEAYCVVAMFNKAKVFMNPATYGAKFGPRAFNYMLLAQKTNPENPRAMFLLGWEKFYTPKAYGGDKAKAKEWFTNAKQKLEINSAARAYPHWGKTEVEGLLKQIK
ncbi:MAG: hypothetical protein JWM28_3342 [Chitinophagaceae bacterium]|nr:hypothetical protein [Chitinophagaceae bacterium]